MSIHPTACIADGANLGDVTIGPFSFIGPGVTLADGVQVGPHCVIHGHTEVGEGTVLWQAAGDGGECPL